MYPTMPILTRDQMQQAFIDVDHSVEAYCLLCSLSAFMMIQPDIERVPSSHGRRSPSPTTNPSLGIILMQEAVRVRKVLDYVESPTVATVITSLFLFGCCFGLNKHNTAWINLREATALAQILGMQEEETYLHGDHAANALKRRLFWLLFVTERYASLCFASTSISASSAAC